MEGGPQTGHQAPDELRQHGRGPMAARQDQSVHQKPGIRKWLKQQTMIDTLLSPSLTLM